MSIPWGKSRKLETASALLALVFSVSCFRPASGQSGDASAQANGQRAPFREATTSSTLTVPSPGSNAQSRESAPELPFRSAMSRTLSAGTLLTVRLEDSLSSAQAYAGETFSAVLDQPIAIGGNVVVERGASVSGRVESAQLSPLTQESASLRLTLDSITIAGKRCLLQTASLFAGETHRPGRGLLPVNGKSESGLPIAPAIVHLNKGRRLTFRLTDAVFLGS